LGLQYKANIKFMPTIFNIVNQLFIRRFFSHDPVIFSPGRAGKIDCFWEAG